MAAGGDLALLLRAAAVQSQAPSASAVRSSSGAFIAVPARARDVSALLAHPHLSQPWTDARRREDPPPSFFPGPAKPARLASVGVLWDSETRALDPVGGECKEGPNSSRPSQLPSSSFLHDEMLKWL